MMVEHCCIIKVVDLQYFDTIACPDLDKINYLEERIRPKDFRSKTVDADNSCRVGQLGDSSCSVSYMLDVK
jgi:hypothetical protein